MTRIRCIANGKRYEVWFDDRGNAVKVFVLYSNRCEVTRLIYDAADYRQMSKTTAKAVNAASKVLTLVDPQRAPAT